MDLGRFIKRITITILFSAILGFAAQYLAAPSIIQRVANSPQNLQRVQAEFVKQAESEIERKFREKWLVRITSFFIETFSLSREILDTILSAAKISAKDFIIKEFNENRILIEIHETPAWIRWDKTDYTFRVVWVDKGQKMILVYFTIDKNGGLKSIVKDEKGLAVIGERIEKIAKEAAEKKAEEERKKFGSRAWDAIKGVLEKLGIK